MRLLQSRSEIPLSQQLWGLTPSQVITFLTSEGLFSAISTDPDRFSFEMRHVAALLLCCLDRTCALQTAYCILKAVLFPAPDSI